MNEENIYDLIIVGSGMAGLSAGLYAGRYRMKTLILGKTTGGEGINSGMVYNYPGYVEIDGFDLMMKCKEQVDKLDVPILTEEITRIEKKGHCFTVTTTKEEYIANTIILATGTKHRTLGLPREEELKGKGLHYCVTCDGPLYKDKTIALVGGGDSSVKGINLVAEYVKKAYLIVRGTELTAEPVNLEQLKKLGDKVEVLYETSVTEFLGKDMLEGVKLDKEIGGSNELAVNGLFVEIGADPDKTFPDQLGVKLDKRGYVNVDNMMRTNVDGVFAAGDSVNHFGSFKQYVTAAAMGAVAATAAYEDNKIHGDLCSLHGIPERVDSKQLREDATK